MLRGSFRAEGAWSLELGAWSLELGNYALSSRACKRNGFERLRTALLACELLLF